VDENVRTTVIGSKEAPIKAQSGQSSPLRGGSPANPVVQRDDGLWSIGWHDGAAGPPPAATLGLPPLRARWGRLDVRYRHGGEPA
jgi:hypothetical protein